MIKNECGHAYKLLDHAECLWCENCVEKLVKRLSKKPEVTEEWIEEKAEKFMLGFPGTYLWQYQSQLNLVKDFIRSLVKEIK